jgi:hypothetical protein
VIRQLTKRASAQPPSRRAPPFADLAPELQVRARAALSYYLARARDRHQAVPPWRYALMCATAVRQAIHGNPPSYNQRLAYRSWKKRRARQRMIEEYGDPSAANPVGSR